MRERDGEREGGERRAGGGGVLCHYCMSLSLYQDEPSRLIIKQLPSPPGMMNWPKGVRSMHLEVEHLRFYTRLASKSDSKATKSERHSSPDKSTGETKKEVLLGWTER
jgi:hypothetical protein